MGTFKITSKLYFITFVLFLCYFRFFSLSRFYVICHPGGGGLFIATFSFLFGTKVSYERYSYQVFIRYHNFLVYRSSLKEHISVSTRNLRRIQPSLAFFSPTHVSCKLGAEVEVCKSLISKH